ncbi:MAG: PilZ domain-containing protein [Terriglobia bacterium]
MRLSDQERRRHKRVPFTMRAPVATGSDSGGRIEDSSTIDISESGVRLRLCGQIAPGQVVDVFLANRPERSRVVWTSPCSTPHEIIAGLEFVRPLPDP